MKTKAILLRENGEPENLQLTELELPALGEHDVLVEMKAAGVSYVDVLMVAGEYQFKPDLPFVPGMSTSPWRQSLAFSSFFASGICNASRNSFREIFSLVVRAKPNTWFLGTSRFLA